MAIAFFLLASMSLVKPGILYNSSSGNAYVELYNKYPEGLGAVKVILANFFRPACLSIHIFIACLTFLFLNASVLLFNDTTQSVISVLA